MSLPATPAAAVTTQAVVHPWRTAIALSVSAALAELILHEATHGLVALAVGKRWDALHLFASASSWPGAPWPAGDGLVAGSSAVVNILTGLGCALALSRGAWMAGRPLVRLWTLYFAAFSILAGFGYLMMDALTYRPGALGDWKRVIGMLGGGWDARGPILALGGAGILAAFFWIPRASLEFLGTGPGRLRPAMALLLTPFIVVSVSMTVLSLGHPLGAAGIFITSLKHWMGYSALAWAPFIAASMAGERPPAEPQTAVPTTPPLRWVLLLAGALAIAVALAQPL